MEDSIRDKYQKYGIKNFYQFHSGEYKNPHEKSIEKSLNYIYNNWNLDFTNVLDLACGKGEVTKSLEKIGINNIEAVDGFLSKEYKKETNRPCLSMTFDNISNGFLKGRNYSLVICSYALHKRYLGVGIRRRNCHRKS